MSFERASKLGEPKPVAASQPPTAGKPAVAEQMGEPQLRPCLTCTDKGGAAAGQSGGGGRLGSGPAWAEGKGAVQREQRLTSLKPEEALP